MPKPVFVFFTSEKHGRIMSVFIQGRYVPAAVREMQQHAADDKPKKPHSHLAKVEERGNKGYCNHPGSRGSRRGS